MIEKLRYKAEILIETLPYIRTFNNKIFVIKYGGSAMKDEELKKDIVHNLILLKYIGIRPVIVHGGGPEISGYLNKMDIQTRFANGLRITDKETMQVVQMVLKGKLNQEIVSLINFYGGKGVGLSGIDGNLILARKHPAEHVINDGGEEELIDLGFVGEVEKIDPSLINSLLDTGFIPVISPIGVGLDGNSYNINADIAAGEIAQALKAEKLIMLSDIEGIYELPDKPETKMNNLSISKAKQMMANHQIK
ncbi:MAG: acetylglutamate kinase, partial [Spirochaetes bacterium]|nr:acetylglutamate kinase [Spirochaetota bacterium]